MSARIRPVARGDWENITAIFNHYVAESFAAYPDQPVDESFFRERHEAHAEYPFVVAESDEAVAGFAYLSPFYPVPNMRRSAVLTYFLHPDHTGQGLGTAFLDHLIGAGRRLGIDNYLAHVSSLNPGSIRFHLERGFQECGCFQAIGVKNGRLFDMVWLQKLEG